MSRKEKSVLDKIFQVYDKLFEISISNIAQSLENILANKIEELKQTISIMDEKNIKQILDAIKKSKNSSICSSRQYNTCCFRRCI